MLRKPRRGTRVAGCSSARRLRSTVRHASRSSTSCRGTSAPITATPSAPSPRRAPRVGRGGRRHRRHRRHDGIDRAEDAAARSWGSRGPGRVRGTAEISLIAVRPSRRGQGIGKRLVERILADFVEECVVVVQATALDASADYEPYDATPRLLGAAWVRPDQLRGSAAGIAARPPVRDLRCGPRNHVAVGPHWRWPTDASRREGGARHGRRRAGIGAGVVAMLAAEGAAVGFTGRSEDKRRRGRGCGHRGRWSGAVHQGRQRREDEVAGAVRTTVETFGKLTTLVNNAISDDAGSGRDTHVDAVDNETFDEIMLISLKGTCGRASTRSRRCARRGAGRS